MVLKLELPDVDEIWMKRVMCVSTLERWSEELLDVIWHDDPVAASMIGITKYDKELPSVDPDIKEQFVSDLSKYAADCERLLSHGGNLSWAERLDVEATLAGLQERILAETSISEWQTNPCFYVSAINNGLHVLLSRDDSLSDELVEAVIKRIEGVPQFLETGARNLDVNKVPIEWLDIALGSVEGSKNMIDSSVRHILCDSGIGSTSVDGLCNKAIDALCAFACFLEQSKPLAQGSFACGRDYFEQILQRVHMVDMDVRQLEEFGRSKISEYELMLREAAKKIDGSRQWTEIISDFKKDHPSPEMLLDSYRSEVRRAEEFVTERDLVSIPKGQKWAVLPAPEFSRMTAPMGYMETSPPFSDELKSILYITPIDPNATIEQQKQHLEDNCYAFQRSIALHEVIPGHHLQSCLAKLGVSDLRKQCSFSVFIEGWGLYTELLMAEQGYLSAPATTLIYLKNALWRAVRVVIDVGLHVTGLTLEEATQLLQDKVRMERHMAFGEARRYTMSPTYQSSYLLGKEQIVSLRSEFAARAGSDYTPKSFHDKLCSYGSIPVSLIRREILAGR